MIVLRSPKGWTGPKEGDGLPAEGTFRAHQVPHANGGLLPRDQEMPDVRVMEVLNERFWNPGSV